MRLVLVPSSSFLDKHAPRDDKPVYGSCKIEILSLFPAFVRARIQTDGANEIKAKNSLRLPGEEGMKCFVGLELLKKKKDVAMTTIMGKY